MTKNTNTIKYKNKTQMLTSGCFQVS